MRGMSHGCWLRCHRWLRRRRGRHRRGPRNHLRRADNGRRGALQRRRGSFGAPPQPEGADGPCYYQDQGSGHCDDPHRTPHGDTRRCAPAITLAHPPPGGLRHSQDHGAVVGHGSRLLLEILGDLLRHTTRRALNQMRAQGQRLRAGKPAAALPDQQFAAAIRSLSFRRPLPLTHFAHP